MLLSSSISKIFAVILVRQQDGSRLYSKYFTKHFQPNLLRIQEGMLDQIDIQKIFEKGVWEKGKRVGAKLARPCETEIFQYSQFNIVMKAFNEISLYVVADFDENEIILSQVINCIYESLSYTTKDQISMQTLGDNLDQVIIIIDEILDDGIVITTDPQIVLARSTMKDCNEFIMPPQESTFSSVFASAKKSFASQFMNS